MTETYTITPTPSVTLTSTISPTFTDTPWQYTSTPEPRLGYGGGYAEPNPFFPGQGQRARFVFSLGEDFTVKIVTIKNRLVCTIHGLQEWDGRDNHGRLVESGVYVYQIVGAQTGVHASGTVVLIAH